MMNWTLHSVKVCNVALWMDFDTKSQYVMYLDGWNFSLSQSMKCTMINGFLH